MNSKPANYVVFGAPVIGEAEIDAVVSVLRSRWIGTGPVVRAFEEQFRAYVDSSQAVALSSCSHGLFLALKALGIGEGDEVITTDMTFCATVNSIIHTGAAPVIVDCSRETLNLCLEGLERAIGPATKAIIPVHFRGYPCLMNRVMEIADHHGIKVIEDCAHAIEARIDGKHCGTFGQAGCFSFYATKNVTSGEGGMIITDDPEFAEEIRVLRNHGLSRDSWNRYSGDGALHYDVVRPGFKANMTDLQAAIGLEQLKRVDAKWSRRAEMWGEYRSALADLPLELPSDSDEGIRHGYHLFTLLLDIEKLTITRDQFITLLDSRGIGSGVHYRSIHEQSYFKNELGLSPDSFPNSSFISERTVSLPFSPALPEGEIERILTGVAEILSEHIR